MIQYAITVADVREARRADFFRNRRSPRVVASLGGLLLVFTLGLFLGLLAAPGWLCLAILPGYMICLMWRRAR